MLARWNRWNPFEDVNMMHREMTNVFDRFFGTVEGRLGPMTRLPHWFPKVEAFYYHNNLVLRAFLPGVEPKNVDVSVSGNLLTIKGERKPGLEIPKEDYLFSEVFYGPFERTLTLPDGLKTDKVNAKYFNGVLEIAIPMAEAVLPKKIAVEVVPLGEKILTGVVR
jgi:HSP20 family protein